MNVLLTDNYSSYNAGDAAILDGMLYALREELPGARFTVTSSYPDVATAVHGIPAVPWTPRSLRGRVAVAVWFARSLAWATLMRRHDGARSRLARHLVSSEEHALLSAYRGADLVIGVGGAYLRAGYRLTSLRLWHLRLAGAMGRPVMLYGASVGPFGGRTWWPTHVLDRLDAITVRDRPSLDELRRIGVARPRVVLAADAALGLPVPIPIPPDGPRPHVGVSVLHWHKFARGNFASYCDAVASALDTLLEDWAAGVTFMSTTVAPSGSADDVSGTSRDDLSAAYEVKGRMKHGDRAATWDRPLGVAELRARIGGFDLWIGTRMHSCIFATTAGLPTVAIGYEPKVAGYFELLGLPELVLDIESVSAADLVRLATNAWRDRDRLQTQMGARLPQLRNDALLSARVAAELAAEGRAGRARAPHSGSRTEA